MIAKSFGKFGDQISLMSPLHKYEQSSVVRFRYYVAQEDPRTAGALAVQLLSIEKAPVKTLFAYSTNKFNSWTQATMCVPAGTYYLLFVARLGQPFVSDVMIDEVAVNKSMTRTTCDREDMQRGKGIETVDRSVLQ
jgi:MAM domain, meprin/A5/mu